MSRKGGGRSRIARTAEVRVRRVRLVRLVIVRSEENVLITYLTSNLPLIPLFIFSDINFFLFSLILLDPTFWYKCRHFTLETQLCLTLELSMANKCNFKKFLALFTLSFG
jgi:hypothetical protein